MCVVKINNNKWCVLLPCCIFVLYFLCCIFVLYFSCCTFVLYFLCCISVLYVRVLFFLLYFSCYIFSCCIFCVVFYKLNACRISFLLYCTSWVGHELELGRNSPMESVLVRLIWIFYSILCVCNAGVGLRNNA